MLRDKDAQRDAVISERESTDCSLVRRFRDGEGDAATELYLRYSDRIARLARRGMSQQLAARFDPEDVVQSVFRTFFRRASEGQFEIPPGDELWQLLLVIATNKVRRLGRFHRQAKRDVTRTVSTDVAADKRQDDQTPLAILELVIQEALEDLPDIQRQMIEMRIQGHSADEIAEATHRCSRTVERVLRRFRDMMTKCIEGSHDGNKVG